MSLLHLRVVPACLAIALTACTPAVGPLTVKPSVSVSTVAPLATKAPAITPTAAPATAAPVTQLYLDGAARYYGQPLAGAQVRIHVLGQATLVGSATAAANGTFRVTLTGVTPGTLLQIVAVAGDKRVATVAAAPAARTLSAAGDLTLDEASTLALLVLGPRLLATLQLNTATSRQQAFDAFQAAATALGGHGVTDQAAFNATVAKVLDNQDQFKGAPQAADLAKLDTTAIQILTQHADSLATVIRDGVKAGGHRPDDSLVQALPVGSSTQASAVFTDGGNAGQATVPTQSSGGGGSGGGGGGGGTIINHVDVTVTVQDVVEGLFNTDGPATGTAKAFLLLTTDTKHRYTGVDVFEFRVKIGDGTVSVVCPQSGPDFTRTAIFHNVATNAPIKLALEAWGNQGGSAADLQLNTASATLTTLNDPAVNSATPFTTTMQAQLDGTAFNGQIGVAVGEPVPGAFATPTAPPTGAPVH